VNSLKKEPREGNIKKASTLKGLNMNSHRCNLWEIKSLNPEGVEYEYINH